MKTKFKKAYRFTDIYMSGNLTHQIKIMKQYYLVVFSIIAIATLITSFSDYSIANMDYTLMIMLLVVPPIFFGIVLVLIYFISVKPLIKEVESELDIEIKWNVLLDQFNRRE